MRDQFELGTTVPHDEPCFQMGENDFSKFSKIEARALINQIIRIIGNPPDRTGLKIISCPHDFGTYYDVAVIYDDDSEESQEWMLKAESGIPCNWDKEAILELKEQGYPVTRLLSNQF
jgi:hypothetical protein